MWYVLTGNVGIFAGGVSTPPLLVYYSTHYYHHHIDNVESNESWEEGDKLLSLKTSTYNGRHRDFEVVWQIQSCLQFEAEFQRLAHVPQLLGRSVQRVWSNSSHYVGVGLYYICDGKVLRRCAWLEKVVRQLPDQPDLQRRPCILSNIMVPNFQGAQFSQINTLIKGSYY